MTSFYVTVKLMIYKYFTSQDQHNVSKVIDYEILVENFTLFPNLETSLLK